MNEPILTLRTEVPDNKSHYYLDLPNGKKFSVVNFGEVMSNAPQLVKLGIFAGWEGMEVDVLTHDLITENCYRASTKEELIEKICLESQQQSQK